VYALEYAIELKVCPDFVIGKCLIITSFDSGPLRVSAEELAKGWREIGNLVIVPRVQSTEELPYDQYDEWLVFPNYAEPEVPETFVNSGLFRLAHFSTLEAEATAAVPNGADILGARYRAGLLAERQERFWDLIVRVNPETWIGNGGVLCSPQGILSCSGEYSQHFRARESSLCKRTFMKYGIIGNYHPPRSELAANVGGLNRSMQHWLAVYSPAFESPRSLAGVG
jgi:hypothetical protein